MAFKSVFRIIAICFLTPGLFLAAGQLSAGDFYVAPTGNDLNPGTRSKPFASLERARNAVRERKQREPDRDYTVWLRGGVYRLKDAVVFSIQDSAAAGRTVTYAAYPNEKPVFSSGLALNGWRQAGRFWVTDLPESVKPFRTLYDRTGRLPRARSAPFSPTRDFSTVEGLDRFTLPFPAGSLKHWPNLAEVDLVIRPNYGWVLNVLPLESVDEAAGVARTRIPASYPMVKVRWGLPDVNAKGTVWVENVLDALDEPGEWVLNTPERKLYLWPRGEQPQEIEAPQLTELIRVEGEIDYDGSRDTPVRGLTFRGLSVARAEGMEQHSVAGDPRFRNPEQGDFRFKSGSPAPKLGIEPIDLRRVGLRK